jgi:branched-chain amino acid transport system permease protein
MRLFLLQLLNGLSYAAVLYLVAVGLSLTYGVGRFLNLAHGGFYLLGAYLAITISGAVNFWAALVVAPLAAAVLGFAVERTVLRRYAGEHRAIEQLLLTFGIAFILSDLMRIAWGGTIRTLSPPPLLTGTVDLGVAAFPVYRLAVVGVGVVVAIALQLILQRTRAGVLIRAAAADQDITASLGIDTGRVLGLTFAAGVALAAFGGVVGGPVIATASGFDFRILILALIVIVVGGLGNVQATLYGALTVGLLETFARGYAPRFAFFSLYLLLAFVLIVRPQGLFVRQPA